jgi:hypothetical protein
MTRRLAPQGVDEQDIALLRDLLDQAAPALKSAWRMHKGDDAELLVIDVDSVYGHMDWLRAHGIGRLVAVLTEHPPSPEYDLVLHKPLSVVKLVEVLDRAAEQSADGPAAVPTPPPAPAPAPAPRTVAKPVAPSPPPPAAAEPPPPPAPPPPRERRLADWLADGAMLAAVRLQTAGAPDLVLDPHNKTYYADGSVRALAPHCARVLAREDWHEVDQAQLASLHAGGKGQPYARLLWLAHALGSNGQLAAGLPGSGRYKLSRWPQIEREFPKHFRIATVMMKQPATLGEVAEQSGATLADVIDFTNAYHAAGYIDIEGMAGAATAPQQRDTGRGAILSRLKNPFGGS